MKITLESGSTLTVRRVTDDAIQIGEQQYSAPLSIASDGTIDAWPHGRVEALTGQDFEALLECGADIVVLGTGRENLRPDRQLVFAMARRGVGLEVMDTRAAARTFNVLVNEERSVAAVFYL